VRPNQTFCSEGESIFAVVVAVDRNLHKQAHLFDLSPGYGGNEGPRSRDCLATQLKLER